MSDYSKQWSDLAKRIRAFFWAWIGGWLLIGVVSLAVHGLALLLFPLWVVAFFVTGWRWSLFSCPRCGKQFFKPNAWAVNQLARRCYHCGLRKWAINDNQTSQ